MVMTTAILIPARYASTRFPGKMMAKLNGVPLVEHVYNRCAATGLDTYVLTDNQEVYNYLGGGKCLYTTEAENGTERCMQVIDEVLQYDRYINVQGDMPDITESIIRAVESELQRSDVATAYTPMDFNLRNDPNSVKMIHSRGRAHWFLHWRSMLRPATLSGNLLARAIDLAGLPPAPRAFDTINSSTSSNLIPLVSIRLFITGAANSFIFNEERGPLIGDTIDLFAPTI